MHFIREKFKYIEQNYLIETIILVIICAILINTLFVSPIVGKCDNGDFARFYVYGGLGDLSGSYKDIYDRTVHVKYGLMNLGIFLPFGINWVSGAILLKAAECICFLSGGFMSGLFDIRYLAFVYSSIFLLGIFLILKNKLFSPVLKLTAGIFIILFFTDASYIAYFNSFFGESAAIVFFFLMIGTFLLLIQKEKPERRHFIYFFIASAGFLTSKSQQLPLLIFMIIIYSGLYVYYNNTKMRKLIMICAVAVVVICAFTYCSLTKYTNYNNIYQSVFFGVLDGSKTPEKDLQELGVDSRFVVFKGRSFYDVDEKNNPLSADMQKNFYSKVSTGKVLVFYLKHLDRLWSNISESAEHAYNISTLSTANFPKGKFSQNKIVNNFRLNLVNRFGEFHHNIYIYMIFSIVYLCVITFYFIRYREKNVRLLTLMLLFILAAGASQFVLPVIGSGKGDFAKHLFLISLAYDTMIGIAIVWVAHLILNFILRKKDKYAV